MTNTMRAVIALESLRMITLNTDGGPGTLDVRSAVRRAIIARGLQMTTSTDDRDDIEHRVVVASIALYDRIPMLRGAS